MVRFPRASLIALLKRFRVSIAAIAGLNLLSSVFFLAAPFFSKFVIDDAFLNKNWNAFLRLSVAGAAVFIFSSLVKLAGEVLKNRISVRVRLKLANSFLRKLYGMDMSFFQASPSGETMYRFFDVETTAMFLTDHIPNMAVDMCQIVIILCISLIVNVQLTVFLLVLSPLFLLRSLYMQKRLLPIFREIWNSSSMLSRRIYESLSHMYIIKALGFEQAQRRTFVRALVKNLRWKVKNFRWLQLDALLNSFLSKFIYGMITLYGGWLIIKGHTSLGSYTAVMIYLTQLGVLFQSASSAWGYCVEESVSFEKFSDIMDAPGPLVEAARAVSPARLTGAITFKDVEFGYDQNRPVFRNLNITIPAGSITGITGLSGCGKSTLVNLILQLYKPWSGTIHFDDIPADTVRIACLRRRIGIASQQPLLFDDTVRNNITCGMKDVPDEAVERAARIACIHDDITALPQGYDTVIGEDACRLSHGQKQRLTIARALARDPDILILDEATASVDSMTEDRIFEGLRFWSKGRSVIFVSHRQSVLEQADTVIMFDSMEGA